jgi:tetratricopeptide (TPR) repeat protein
MKKNKPRDALKYFSETVKYDPDHALAYYYMGDILRAERKFKDAAEAFLQSLKADPCDPDTYVQLAICMIELHQPNEAKEAIRRALQLDPQHELGLKIGQQMGIA